MNKEKGIYWCKWKSLGETKSQGDLGFRDLEAFNKVLLAKQIWRLAQNSTTLTSQIQKAKYYPHTTVLDAKVGHTPSLIWRSISSFIELVEKGILWRIGDGTLVNI